MKHWKIKISFFERHFELTFQRDSSFYIPRPFGFSKLGLSSYFLWMGQIMAKTENVGNSWTFHFAMQGGWQQIGLPHGHSLLYFD